MTRVTGRRKPDGLLCEYVADVMSQRPPRWNPSPCNSSCTKLCSHFFTRRVSTTTAFRTSPLSGCACALVVMSNCVYGVRGATELDATRMQSLTRRPNISPLPQPPHLPTPPHSPPPPPPQEVDVNQEFMCEWLIGMRAVAASGERQRKLIRCVRAVCCSLYGHTDWQEAGWETRCEWRGSDRERTLKLEVGVEDALGRKQGAACTLRQTWRGGKSSGSVFNYPSLSFLLIQNMPAETCHLIFMICGSLAGCCYTSKGPRSSF